MKTFIQNRKGQKIAVIIDQVPDQKGVAFVMHGLGGYKEQPHIVMLAEAWGRQGYTVIRFDTTNTFGESDGQYEDATVTNYYEDLEDVIAWGEKQSWFQEPFCLTGHSLGGICTALYAEKNPMKVKALAPLSTVVSGRLSIETKSEEEMKKWKETGWQEKPSNSHPGVMKRLKWSHVADRLRYDLLPEVEKLRMPVFLCVGEKDVSTLPEHQQLLLRAIPGPKELHIIAGAPHTFKEQKHLEQIQGLFEDWIQKL